MSDINRRRMRQPKGRSSYKSQSQSELDRFLEGKSLWRKHIAKDGSCLFRAVAEQVYLSQVDHLHVRRECVEYIRQHQSNYKEFLEEPVDSYLFKLCHPTSWAGEIELSALAEIYHRRIEVYHYHSNQVALKSFGPEQSREPSILLAYSDGNHYDSIMTKDYRNNSAICQSILYELLFESVLQVTVPDRKHLQQYNSRQHRDYLGDPRLKNFCSDDLMAFSSRIYFNAALGVHKTYREDLESQDWQIAMAMQFQEGDECQVWIDLHRKEKKLYDGVIRATNTSKGKHRVFIHDLKKTMEVKHQDFNVLSLVGGRRPSHIKNSDWLTQQNKKKANDKPSSGKREKGSQGKLSSEKGRTKTYLMASHRKKREQVVTNNLESDEVDPEIQEQLRLIELQDKENSFPALSSQAAKAVTESYDVVTSQSVVCSSSPMVTSVPVVTTTIVGSLPSSVMPKVKPIQKQQKPFATTGPVISIQPAVTSAALTRQQPKNSYSADFMSSNDSPLNSTEEFFSAKNIKTAVPNTSLGSGSKEFFSAKDVTAAAQITSMMAPKVTVAVKENQLVLHDGPVQQHTDVAKQLMQVIHREKESQQSSERQLMTLSMTMSSNSSTDLHSSWPELLSQDEQRATPLNMQEQQQGVALPTLSTMDLSSVPISKSPYATQALPTANTITHMPSTAVKVAKAPPSFFTTTIAPPTTGQATPTTKAAQGTMTAMRTSSGMTSSGVQPMPSNRISMVTGNQATPAKKVHSISANEGQSTTTSKALVTGGLATLTSNRAPPMQYQNFSGPNSSIKTSGFAGTTIAPPTTTAAGSLPTATGAPHVTSPKALNLELPLVQLPNPPLQLFQDGENGYFFEQYGRMCFAILLERCPDITHLIHGVEAKLSEKTHSHDIDYSEEERRLIEEQSQRLESWKRSSTGILHTMKDLQRPPQSERLMMDITKPTGLPVGETVISSQPQDGTRKLQIVFPSLKEPVQQDSAIKEFGTQEKDRDCFKNLNKEELEMLHSLMKKLDFHQLQSDTTAAGGASSDETISAHTTSSLPPSDTEGTLSTASEPTAQLASPIQTVPEAHPSESQSAESSTTSPDVDPSLQPTSEGANQENMAVDTDVSTNAEKPGEEKPMEHQHNSNLDSEGAAFTPGMMPAHNPMAAMATMGHFIPPAAAAGFMPTMLPAPMNPYMMIPQNFYLYHHHQQLLQQQAHYNQIMQQTMAVAALNSPTMPSGNQEEGSFFQQKDTANPSIQDTHIQAAMDPVEVTANTNHIDNEQLRGNSPLQDQDDFTSSPSGFPMSSVNLQFDRVTQGINMAPSSFTGTTPIVANSLPLSAEDSMSMSNSQLQFATDEHQTAVTKDLIRIPPPKLPVVPSQSEPVSTDNSYKTNHIPQREVSRSYASHHNTSHHNTSSTNIKTNHTSMCKQPQSNKQDNSKPSSSIQQRTHHSKYDGRSIDHELSQMGMHNSFPNGIPSMVFSSEKRRKSQQT